MNKKWDWSAIEVQYVKGDMSLRELARDNAINNHSSVMRHSKTGEWPRKRAEFRANATASAVGVLSRKSGEAMADEVLVRDNAVHAIDEMVTRLRGDLHKTKRVMRDGEWVEEPLIIVRPNDVAMLIDRLQVLFGRPSQITEDRALGVELSTDDPAILRDIIKATRGIGLDTGTGAESPLPSAPKDGEEG